MDVQLYFIAFEVNALNEAFSASILVARYLCRHSAVKGTLFEIKHSGTRSLPSLKKKKQQHSFIS